jgi:hypothetical protein
MVDDYRYRWTYIRKACNGIYLFFNFFLYQLPKFLVYYLPKYLIQESGKGLMRMYRAIPPIKQWPKILGQAIISIAKGIRDVVIDIVDIIKATPKALYRSGKYLAKKFWSGIKAVPSLVKQAAKMVGRGLKRLGLWIANLFTKYSQESSS